jgi:hypothetical protein
MTKKSNPELPPAVGQPDPHSFLDCCQLSSLAILTPQYIVIAAQFFYPPTTPGGLALQPELLKSKLLFSDPT